MNPLGNALRNATRHVGSTESSLLATDLDDSRFTLKELTHCLFAQFPSSGKLLDRIVCFAGQIHRLALFSRFRKKGIVVKILCFGFSSRLDLMAV